ncbi:sensor histidine kinase [Paramagnetospirillum magnetotacticum MS-1]|uniref:histidine kinase n=1 Tax=Paramagnetospirillum magnetotacticum MS-1 TaxID=272627 RepID=A0A0C2YL96_PARME|nr:ATP-binding protein [Paramagnetospirillum magnetotacticum]KIM00550.1 sensor histidine kinase [Paramagnetospirillum magnetotacticum MS-1]
MSPLLKRFLPDSVVGRTALVLVAALMISAATAVVLFDIQRQEALETIGGRNAAERVAALVTLAEQLPPEQRQDTLSSQDTANFRVGWGTQPVALDDENFGLTAYVRSALEEGLEGREVKVSTRPGPLGYGPNTGMGRGGGGGGRHMRGPGEGPGPGFGPPSESRPGFGGPPAGGPGGGGRVIGPALRVSVHLKDGSWLNVLAPLDLGDPLWRPRFVAPLIIALVLVTLFALLAVRRATRPFAAFAQAAERLGINVSAPALAETGPREVRQAAQAFNVMQGRITRFVQDRTQMLAAISHDLKTPITRLRLRAEFMEDDDQRAKMLCDLEEMEAMIASTLAFARDDAAREPSIRLDLAAMIQGMVEDMEELGGRCSYDGPQSLVLDARPVALKRALANLMDNAVKYGGSAALSLTSLGQDARITIEDQGPGIPEEARERVFAPFVRLETSRSRETGGTGLGLAVARAAIRAHGGDITLGDRPGGGLRVTVTLPGMEK